MYSKLAPKGVAGFVLANGSLSTTNKQEYNIRKGMLEDGVIDCIITLPDKLFYTTGIPVSLWFIRKNKTNKNVLFIDARNMGEMIDRKVRELKDSDLDTISNTYHSWQYNNGYEDKKGFCKSATLEEIREADYTLVPGRYVGIDDSNKMSEEEINAEIKKISEELLTLFEESKELEEKVIEILKQNI